MPISLRQGKWVPPEQRPTIHTHRLVATTAHDSDFSEIPDLKVRLHHFSWCLCGNDSFPAEHVKLETMKRPLKPGHAIALSYAIGDFDREENVFGHRGDPDLQSSRLEFGGEWEIRALMKALVDLSEAHGAIWIDQLSITQDSASITIHQQAMPRIYCTLEVQILLPNAPCLCLQEALHSYDLGDVQYADDDGEFDTLHVWDWCLNAFTITSYNFRLWTKQEFCFARTISIHYCQPSETLCCRGSFRWIKASPHLPTQDPRYFSRWSRWKYARCVEQARDKHLVSVVHEVAWSQLAHAHFAGSRNLSASLVVFRVKRDAILPLRLHSFAFQARFELQAKLHTTSFGTSNNLVLSAMHSEHVATKLEDYALAVLPSIRSYSLPLSWDKMTLPELMDDGFEQYEADLGLILQTKLPKGLFEQGLGSMQCKPSLYLRSDKVKVLGDVYSASSNSTFVPVPGFCGEAIMMCLRNGSRTFGSRLVQSKTYSEVFGQQKTAESLGFMQSLQENRNPHWIVHGTMGARKLSGWARRVIRGELSVPDTRWSSLAQERAMFGELMFRRLPWPAFPEIDHERLFYDLACEFAGIHPDVAREKKLGLLVKKAQPSYIGLFDGRNYAQTAQSPCIGLCNGKTYDRIRQIELGSPDCVGGATVLPPHESLTTLTRDCDDRNCPALEVQRVDTQFDTARLRLSPEDQPKSTYAVVGVW